MRHSSIGQIVIAAMMGAGFVNGLAAQRRGTAGAISAISKEASTMPRQSKSVDTIPDPVAVRQWASLTAHLIEAFREDHRSPVANIEGDFSELEIRLRLTSRRDDVWVERKFTTAELLSLDAKATAKTLYDAAKRRL
jgi:hypothetical protein